MLLAIDTSAGTSVALVDPDAGRVLAERSTEDTRRHAEVVGPFLAELFDASGTTPADVAAVVAGMGPGPFTGLRVGIAAARTFAAARGIPCLPVVSHDAVAAGHDGPVVVLTDARRRELYWSAYDASGARVAGPGLAKPADLDAALGDASSWERLTAVTIPAGRLGLVAAGRLAAASSSAGPPGAAASGTAASGTAASVLATLSTPRDAASSALAAAGFAADVPLYLRDPDVTMPGAPKRVVR